MRETFATLFNPATKRHTVGDSKQQFVYPPILQAARDLRHPLTPTERQLWTRVRNRQLGYKIRRQHPIFRFIADFFCAEAMLVIEIDGDTHGEPEQAKYDKVRTEWLEARGYRVMRFDNRDVMQNMEGVLEAIRAACAVGTAARK
jgi:very-short-patch-repair endonuclease